MSKIKSCADLDGDRPPLRTKPPRIPPAFTGIQYNFCKNPACANYGIEPKLKSKQTDHDFYTLSGGGKSLTLLGFRGRTPKSVRSKYVSSWIWSQPAFFMHQLAWTKIALWLKRAHILFSYGLVHFTNWKTIFWTKIYWTGLSYKNWRKMRVFLTGKSVQPNPRFFEPAWRT
jgi:hypothetical protein